MPPPRTATASVRLADRWADAAASSSVADSVAILGALLMYMYMQGNKLQTRSLNQNNTVHGGNGGATDEGNGTDVGDTDVSAE